MRKMTPKNAFSPRRKAREQWDSEEFCTLQSVADICCSSPFPSSSSPILPVWRL